MSKIVISWEKGVYYASVVEESGDEFGLTRAEEYSTLIDRIKEELSKTGETIDDVNLEAAAEVVDIREDFPNRDEAYAILKSGDRYAFAWGPKYPYDAYGEPVPALDVEDGESGIEWFGSEEAARAAMQEAIEAWATK